MSDEPTALDPPNSNLVQTAVADSMKSLRHFAMVAMSFVVLIVLVGMILFIHSQGNDHSTTQHSLNNIIGTLNQDKQAIITSCKTAVVHVTKVPHKMVSKK